MLAEATGAAVGRRDGRNTHQDRPGTTGGRCARPRRRPHRAAMVCPARQAPAHPVHLVARGRAPYPDDAPSCQASGDTAPPGRPDDDRPHSCLRGSRRHRRTRSRVNQYRRRARPAARPSPPRRWPGSVSAWPRRRPAWDLPADPACAGADPGLFFGPERESPEARGQAGYAGRRVLRVLPGEPRVPRRRRGSRRAVWRLGRHRPRDRARSARRTKRPGQVQAHLTGPDQSLSNTQEGSPMKLTTRTPADSRRPDPRRGQRRPRGQLRRMRMDAGGDEGG